MSPYTRFTGNARIRFTILAAVGAAVTVSVLAGCAGDTSADVPTGADLEGSWDQTGVGYEMGSPVTWTEQTLVIEEAEGQGFGGFKEYTPDGEEPQKEIVSGVVGVDGEIKMVDEDGFFEGRMVEGKILGLYVESGADNGAVNVELSRE